MLVNSKPEKLPMTRWLSMLLLVLPLAAGAQSAAPVFNAKGFFLGAALNGSAIDSDELSDGTDSGGGLTLQLGFGFNPSLAIFLEGAAASIDADGESWILSHGDLGLRYHFVGAARKFVPFVEGSAGTRMGTLEDATLGGQQGDLEISGPGFTLGGGFLYFFNQGLGLNTSLKWTTGEFTTVKFRNVSVSGFEYDATTTRLSVGLTWFPGKR